MNTDQIRINTHSSIRIGGTKILYIDPFQIEDAAHDADVIFVTHGHFDHYDRESIEKIRKEGTVFVMPAAMKKEAEETGADVCLLSPGESREVCGLQIEAVPAYNKMKPFHPKHSRWVGYRIDMDGVRYYIAGDTDALKELRNIRCDIALVPVGGTYTMTAGEAADLINQIRPAVAVPTHYGSIVGKKKDADIFRSLVSPEIEVAVKL